MIHTVRQPFMCHRGQFGDDKQKLCIGIAVKALKSSNPYRFRIGKNPAIYSRDSVEILAHPLVQRNLWKNQTVAIVPVEMFKREEKKDAAPKTSDTPKPSPQPDLFS